MIPAIYASDPDAAPDRDFVPGALPYLVAGNTGRLLDARRTPITVTAVWPERGAFEVEIGAFEDAGARWELPLWDACRFQFARGTAVAGREAVGELERAAAHFDRDVVIDAAPGAAAETWRRVEAERSRVGERLRQLAISELDLPAHIAAREGETRLFDLLEEDMAARGVAELDREFAATFVSNPSSGELVKGHAIMLAELGLCRYQGKIPRDRGLFAGPWSKKRRAAHIVARLAFTQELWASLSCECVTLYRGAAVDGALPERSPSSFVSATFSREVALEHFDGGPATRTSVLWRQDVPVWRLFMTFLETREMSRRYKEAEAILIGDPRNRTF